MPTVTAIRFDSVNIFGYGPCIYSDCFVFSVHSRKTVRGDFSRCTLYGRKSEIVLQTFVRKIILKKKVYTIYVSTVSQRSVVVFG